MWKKYVTFLWVSETLPQRAVTFYVCLILISEIYSSNIGGFILLVTRKIPIWDFYWFCWRSFNLKNSFILFFAIIFPWPLLYAVGDKTSPKLISLLALCFVFFLGGCGSANTSPHSRSAIYSPKFGKRLSLFLNFLLSFCPVSVKFSESSFLIMYPRYFNGASLILDTIVLLVSILLKTPSLLTR